MKKMIWIGKAGDLAKRCKDVISTSKNYGWDNKSLPTISTILESVGTETHIVRR